MTGKAFCFSGWDLLICGLALWMAMALPGRAQTTTAAFEGTVTDPSGGVLAGAQVTVLNTDTGLRRSVTTGPDGRFLVSQLPPGPYQITVTMTGFETLVRGGMTLTVGQQANLSLGMQVGAVNQQVTVTEEAPIVETTQSAVSGVVDEKRITDLPLNGRDFTQLALIEPSVVNVRNASSGNPTLGFGTRVSVAGSRPDQTGWLLDGLNIRSSTQFGTPGSAGGGIMGVDSVREFQVLTTNYSPEFGGTSGGVINMVTKSGTNQLHGSAYEFLRNSDLDARNFFDVKKPAFKRNQFGASLGGPIKKDKTFFFGNYEGLRQPLGLPNNAIVPDAAAHMGLVPVKGGLQQVAIAPSTAPILNMWPLPNAGEIGGANSGFGSLLTSGNQITTENYFMVRVDHHITDNQSLFGRLSFDNGSQNTPDLVPVDNILQQTAARYATVQLVSVWTTNLLTTTRLGYSRNHTALNLAMDVQYPKSAFFLNPQYPPEIQLSGYTNFGPDSSNIQSFIQNNYEIEEALSYTHGSHALRFGADIQKIDPNIDGGPDNNGMLKWASPSDFIQDNPLTQVSTALPGGTSQRSFRQTFYGFYVNDDWKMTSRLTWNIGLRYDPFTGPTEKWGRIATVPNWLTATQYQIGGQYFTDPCNKCFAPRVGFAWDPRGNGKTAVRGGFGIFYAPLFVYNYNRSATRNAPFSGAIKQALTNADGTPGNFATSIPDILRIAPAFLVPQLTPGVSSPLALQYHPNPTYDMKLNLTVEQQLAPSVSLSVGYVGGRGIHLTRQADINSCYPTIINGRTGVIPCGGKNPIPLPNPNIFQGQDIYTDGQSYYNALQVLLKKRLSNNFQLQAAYTFSKDIDNSTSGSGNSDYPTDGASSQPWNPKADRGLSTLDQEHNLVINGIWSLPSPTGPKLVSSALGGWQFSGILTAGSGNPFSATESNTNVADNGSTGGSARLRRPDWIATQSFSSIINSQNPNQYFTTGNFVLPPTNIYGDLGRGTFIGPGILNFDMNLTKSFPLKFREGSRVEFRGDLFNLFNRANFSAPQPQVINGSNGSVIASAGTITSTSTKSREVQFSLKLVF